mmetsp:Transcript_44171/g.106433  ORF Transcript_44171/g.106433 Transcript_44171/m.106433 type:complete len:135 (+) Transcript_44171:250-654(+)
MVYLDGRKMPEKSNATWATSARTSDSTAGLDAATAAELNWTAIVLANSKLEETIGDSAIGKDGAKAPPKMDPGATSDSIGIAHAGATTSTKAALSWKQTVVVSSVRMIEVFIVFAGLEPLVQKEIRIYERWKEN